MQKVALIVFGQFRTATLILENNIQELKRSFNNQTEIEFHLYILTEIGRAHV